MVFGAQSAVAVTERITVPSNDTDAVTEASSDTGSVRTTCEPAGTVTTVERSPIVTVASPAREPLFTIVTTTARLAQSRAMSAVIAGPSGRHTPRWSTDARTSLR